MRIDGKGLIDRTQSIPFVFDGASYSGYAGDTLTSALLANGVRLMGRSFKYRVSSHVKLSARLRSM